MTPSRLLLNDGTVQVEDGNLGAPAAVVRRFDVGHQMFDVGPFFGVSDNVVVVIVAVVLKLPQSGVDGLGWQRSKNKAEQTIFLTFLQ